MLILEQASRVSRRVQLFASDVDDDPRSRPCGQLSSIVSVIGAARLRRFFIATNTGTA
jgi:hypothetical protein